MGLWQRIIDKADEQLAQWQTEGAENTHLDLRLREGITLLASSLINRFMPHQDGSPIAQTLTNDMTNIVMTDYNDSVQNAQILSAMDKEFLPQPSMLAHWAEAKGFQKIKPHNNAILPQDAADKYILTYYPPAAQSWAKRTGDDLNDTTNKHWYSHTKSSLYDSDGNPIGSSNPELLFNDTAHDATVYVPEDSISYAIDYKKLGLRKEDVADGFRMQSEGINIMDPNIQQSIFRLQDAGLNCDDIVRLWRANTDITNAENVSKIENTLKQSNRKEDIFSLDLIESENAYRYNLQDRSCAIQPTAPLLYATSAKIQQENLNEEQAQKLRQNIGLYNIYDEKNYGNINRDFYAKYEKDVMKNFKEALLEDAKKLIKQPKETLTEIAANTANAAKWLGAKTLRWAPHAAEITYSRFLDHEHKARTALMLRIHDDADKFKQFLSSINPKNLLQKYLPTRNTPAVQQKNDTQTSEQDKTAASLMMQKRLRSR
ncbi:MAG: hypothetical protein IJ770_03815 [Alphaproteobacteria bacterium]|nr:hypothetical protein [Alphaproteobacteria bacterium]